MPTPDTDTRPPATDRLYTFDEICEMLGGWGALPAEVGETNEEAVAGWVEHMEAGGFEVGLDPSERSQAASTRQRALLAAAELVRIGETPAIDYEDEALRLVAQAAQETGIRSSTMLQEAIVFSQLHVARMTAELGKTIGSAPR